MVCLQGCSPLLHTSRGNQNSESSPASRFPSAPQTGWPMASPALGRASANRSSCCLMLHVLLLTAGEQRNVKLHWIATLGTLQERMLFAKSKESSPALQVRRNGPSTPHTGKQSPKASQWPGVMRVKPHSDRRLHQVVAGTLVLVLFFGRQVRSCHFSVQNSSSGFYATQKKAPAP